MYNALFSRTYEFESHEWNFGKEVFDESSND